MQTDEAYVIFENVLCESPCLFRWLFLRGDPKLYTNNENVTLRENTDESGSRYEEHFPEKWLLKFLESGHGQANQNFDVKLSSLFS